MGAVATSLRYWHTLRHLKPGQFTARAWHRIHRPRPDSSPAPELSAAQGWVTPIARPRAITGSRARFLSVERDIAGPSAWNDPSIPKLWLYNLHYHEDLRDPDPSRADEQLAFARRWIAENPPGLGNGWEPYPVSLRIVNWVAWSLGHGGLPHDLRHSLAMQVRWLGSRVEHHLLANHLFVNAKALALAGIAFRGAEADRWLAHGMALLRRELPVQVLSDGGHFELSPMYHALILEDVLDLVNAARAIPGRVEPSVVASWEATAARMLGWLRVMTHPDGEIAFFNDAAFGIAPTPAALMVHAERLGIAEHGPAADALIDLAASGYARATAGRAVVLVDAAAIGPDEQPGHAHADTLSFELSIGMQRVIVNGGTSTYATGAQRSLERATRSHSTLELRGMDSSEVWGGFRVARRARIIERGVEARPDSSVRIHAAHDGYRRVDRRAIHARIWELHPGRLVVTDCMPCGPAVTRMILHPSVVPDGAQAARLPDGTRLTFACEGGRINLAAATWSPAFGRIEQTHALEASLEGERMSVAIGWT